MALDFPTSPANGATYSGYTYDATKGVWVIPSSTITNMTVSDTAPSNPLSGDSWFDSTTGYVFVYYTDADSSQWVQSTGAYIDTALTNRVTTVENTRPLSDNYIINGGFDIWQRGTSFTSNGYGADRFIHAFAAGSATISRSTDVPSNQGFTYSLSSASTSGTNPLIAQRIESANSASIAGKTVTLSVWAKSTVGTGPLVWDAAYPTATDNWTSETYDTGGTFAATMTVGNWTRYSATFTANALATRGYRITIYRNVTTTSTTTLYTGVQLENGSIATPFRRNAPSIQAELAACQRYYAKSYAQDVVPGTVTVNGNAIGIVNTSLTTVAAVMDRFPSEMRGIPVISVWGTNGVANQSDAVGAGTTTITLVSRISTRGFAAIDISPSRSGGTMIVFQWVANAEL